MLWNLLSWRPCLYWWCLLSEMRHGVHSVVSQKKVVVLYCLMTKFNCLYTIFFWLPTIIHVIQGTSQTGSKNNFSFSIYSRSWFFQVEGCDVGTLWQNHQKACLLHHAWREQDSVWFYNSDHPEPPDLTFSFHICSLPPSFFMGVSPLNAALTSTCFCH